MMQCVTSYRFVKDLCLTFHNGWFVAVKSFMTTTEHVGSLAFYSLWCNNLTENGKERVCLSERERERVYQIIVCFESKTHLLCCGKQLVHVSDHRIYTESKTHLLCCGI